MIVPESVDLELDCSQCEGKYHDIKNNQLLNHKDHQGSCKNMLLCSIKKSVFESWAAQKRVFDETKL